MTAPDDNRGGPPAPGQAGWMPDASRPGPQPGWTAQVTGPAAGPQVPARAEVEPARLFGIVIAALGALNFAFGFLPQVTASRIDRALSVYAVGPAYVPILLLIAGIMALAAFLPGSERSRLAVAAVSLGGAAGALISLGTDGPVELLTSTQVGKGMGAVLLTIFGIIQAVVAIAAYVVGSDPRRSVPPREPTAADVGPPEPRASWYTPPPASPDAQSPWSQRAGSVGYFAGHAPVPGSAGGQGQPGQARPNQASPAGSVWEPPVDDRPTGPQPVVEPTAGDPEERSGQAPAERELPRAAPDEGKTEVYQVPSHPPAPSAGPGTPTPPDRS